MWILSASLDVWANRTCARKGQTEDRAVIAAPALVGAPVKAAVGGLDQRGVRELAVSAATCGTKAVQRSQRAVGSDFEDGAAQVGAAAVGCTVEIAADGLHQPRGRIGAVSAPTYRTEAVERGQGSAGGNLEDRAATVGPALGRGPVKVAVTGLQQLAVGELAVRAPCLRTEAVERGQGSAGGDFEDRPAPKTVAVTAAGPAVAGGPVKVTVRGLNQPPRIVAVGAVALRAKAVGVVSVPLGVILKIVPQPSGQLATPPEEVVP